MNAEALIPSRRSPDRPRRLFAQLRHRQLQAALAGNIAASARYAGRAMRVRRAARQTEV